MSFIWPEMLWLLLFLPVLGAVYIIILRRRQKYAVRYASLSIVKTALGRGPGFRRHIPALLFLVGLAIMLIALARPAVTITLPSQEGTIILALDVSRSMEANDLQPTRLEAAKSTARSFVGNQPKNVKIGVVSFSNTASVVQAPTDDREQVLAAINRLEPQSGTAIGLGILTSLEAIFEKTGATPLATPTDTPGSPLRAPLPATTVPPGAFAPAAIILLSDGQNNVPPPPLSIVERAGDVGVRVYTVGLGSSQGSVLKFMGRSTRVLLDEDTLKSIAEETNARYFKAENKSELQNIYSNLGTQLVFKPQQTEMTAWFTGFAAVVLVAAVSISLLWFRRIL